MQNYLIFVNNEHVEFGFVAVPPCFRPSDEVRELAEAFGYGVLIGGLSFMPTKDEIELGGRIFDALCAIVQGDEDPSAGFIYTMDR